MQAAVNAYFTKMEDWKSLEDEVQWHTLHTDLQWKCIMECNCASVNDPSNPLLTMLERICLAMHKAPKVGYIYDRQGKYDKALEHYTKALRI
jgi:tetratricopeptide (TPR) repeat protein